MELDTKLTKTKPIKVSTRTLDCHLDGEFEIALAAETALSSVGVRIAALEGVELVHDAVDALAVRHTLAGPDAGLFQGLEVSPQHFLLVLTMVLLVCKHVPGRAIEFSVQNGAETATSCVELFCMFCQ